MDESGELFISGIGISKKDSPKIEKVEFHTSNQRAQIVEMLVGTVLDKDRKPTIDSKIDQTYVIEGSRMQKFIEAYRKDPKEVTSAFRVYIIDYVRNESIPQDERKRVLGEMVDHYLQLIPKMDLLAFPPTGPDVIYDGVPSYVPDGMSDMGSDKELDDSKRIREKIRVNKSTSYQKSKDVFVEALWAAKDLPQSPSSKEVKTFLASYMMTDVFKRMPYNFTQPDKSTGYSIPIDRYVDSKVPEAVCRHIAMETQLRLQALGLESRLLKCTLNDVPHVANLIRIDSQWYLIDTTNPEVKPENINIGKVYARKIELTTKPTQTWNLDRNVASNGKLVTKPSTYKSRNNMYYRILKNQ